MSLRYGLPTPPPLSNEEYKEYVDSVIPCASKSTVNHQSRKEPAIRYERKMGDTELSYFLPSRQYLHLGFHAPERLVRRARVCIVWAILRLRHPLLSASVEMHDYDDVRFLYDAPSSVDAALASANANLEYRADTKDELIDSYLNGSRTLSNERLSYLVVSQPADSIMPTPPRTPSPSRTARTNTEVAQSESGEYQYDLLICAMHFLGDGMALHQFANDFFGLLGGEHSDEDLTDMLRLEWDVRWGTNTYRSDGIIPATLEDSLPVPSTSSFRRAAEHVDFQLSQSSLLGGQTFPKQKHPERHTVVPTFSIPHSRTKAILKKCKEQGVSISAALFAVCNVAWARMGGGKKELPAMMYSALNLRPYFARASQKVAEKALWDSYWFLAIGYFNVVLPNFLPAGAQEATFWHRARQAKAQSAGAAKNRFIVSRTREMAKERGTRARAWGKEDDERERGTWVPPADTPKPPSVKDILPARAPVPSAALIGLSLLGNLDGTYAHATFPAIKLHTLTTGSRQRHGAMLLFGYTFKGKLWVSLGYDENGFKEGVVERFWEEVENCVEEFLG
ncbi:uncharacterized protein FIBRA_05252 [Fibroporia radiculosa]|uniref:Alcohol acetyltransferase n=1 Tax=Fibroporia radiculosa TaxID=599839 RepID=J4IAL7_9APHY|nr:uncharacterized protein FIBRA_05252 [Fibroporia radiculosa]CCM03131.1 predicted protein [Fibroporia radiculosa]